MYIFLKNSHNQIGMLVLFLLLVIILSLLVQFILKKTFGRASKALSLIGLIVVHLQILVGVVLYFLSPLGINSFSGESMKHTISRFYMAEHPVGMIIAAVLITIGYKQVKSTIQASAKYKRVLVYYTLGFAIIAYLIPWFLWS